MKRFIYVLIMGTAVMLLNACIDMMKDVQDVERATPVEVSFRVSATTQFIPKDGQITPDPNFSTENITVEFINQRTAQKYIGKTDSEGLVTINVDPGVYNISASGIAEHNNSKYLINGTITSISLVNNISRQEAMNSSDLIVVRPTKVGSLILSELYYCGCKSSTGNTYFKDQSYRIYNNGDKVEYLDGLCFAELFPKNGAAKPTLYPDEDGIDNFIYAMTIWQIPGSGQEFPLNPGESVVLVQQAYDHTKSNDASYDNSAANWECNSGNTKNDNAAVPNMPYIYYPSPNPSQWLTTVNGPSFALFRGGEGVTVNEEYYRMDGGNVQSPVNNKYDRLAKIPVDWVIDCVEMLATPDDMTKKRIPGSLDAGAASVGATYVGKTISRKVLSTRQDGTPVYQDTNNSTNDFEINDKAVLRRNGEKAPAWSINQ